MSDLRALELCRMARVYIGRYESQRRALHDHPMSSMTVAVKEYVT